MIQYLLDTNICIYIRRAKPPEVLARFATLKSGDVGMSVITYAELAYGACKSDRPAEALVTLSRLVKLIPALPLPVDAAEHAGAIRAHLEKKGTVIGGYDLLIAAHALALQIPVVTNNVSEFKRVPGLRVENWVKAGKG